MKPKAAAFLELIRFPNLLTAMADVLAGILLVGAAGIPLTSSLGLLITTVTIYAAGCILNDLRDRQRDAVERPRRPLPSGRISPGAAWALLILFFSMGLSASLLAGPSAFIVALLLILLVIAYNVRFKKYDVLGPAGMAACRSLNLFLGMSGGFGSAGIALIFPFLTFPYVYSLTILSRFEVHGGSRTRRTEILGGWTVPLAVLSIMGFCGFLRHDGLWFLALLVILTGPALVSSLWKATPKGIRSGVTLMILCLPVLDAAYTSGIRGWQYGIPVALCGPAAWLLARRFAVT